MVEAAFEDKKVLGGVRERREDSNIHRNNRLLYDGNRAEKDGNQLDKLFGKPNYNIVNDLDGSSEPSLF